MSISVKCPNGHALKVKDQLAGKAGLCPYCRSPVFVPMPVQTAEKARISDDEILGVLGPPRKVKPEPAPLPPTNPQMESIHDGVAKEESGISLLGSSALGKQKACPLCGHLASIAFTHCSRCGTPLPNVESTKK